MPKHLRHPKSEENALPYQIIREKEHFQDREGSKAHRQEIIVKGSNELVRLRSEDVIACRT